MNTNITWMEEKVEDVPSNKLFFKFWKFITGRRKKGITYKDLYIIYTHIYDFKKNDISLIKEMALKNILEIYYYNNNIYPI